MDYISGLYKKYCRPWYLEFMNCIENKFYCAIFIAHQNFSKRKNSEYC
jgi:hypothetical protein